MKTLGLIGKTALWTLGILFVFTFVVFVLNLVWSGIIAITPLPDGAENFPMVAVVIASVMFMPKTWWPFKNMKLPDRTKRYSQKEAYTIIATIVSVLMIIFWGIFKVFPWENTGV